MKKDIPALLDGYKLTVVEPPAIKMREDNGREVQVTDRNGTLQFVVSVFAKQRASAPGQRVAKGEEVKVTLETDPGPGFEEGSQVALIDPRVSFYEMTTNGRTNAGLAWKARGLSPVGSAPAPAPRPSNNGENK
jgi:hypothetical protein